MGQLDKNGRKRVEVTFNKITEKDMIDFLESTRGSNAGILKLALREYMLRHASHNIYKHQEDNLTANKQQIAEERKADILNFGGIKPMSSNDFDDL